MKPPTCGVDRLQLDSKSERFLRCLLKSSQGNSVNKMQSLLQVVELEFKTGNKEHFSKKKLMVYWWYLLCGRAQREFMSGYWFAPTLYVNIYTI